MLGMELQTVRATRLGEAYKNPAAFTSSGIFSNIIEEQVSLYLCRYFFKSFIQTQDVFYSTACRR